LNLEVDPSICLNFLNQLNENIQKVKNEISYTVKYENKNLHPIKRQNIHNSLYNSHVFNFINASDIILSPMQRAIIVGTLLGDSSIQENKNQLVFSQCYQHLDYLEHI
jgi:hypothetical protein